MKKILLIFMFVCVFLIASCKDNRFDNPYFMVTVGEQHMVAVSPSNQVYTWGQNLYGQLGTGEFGIDKHSSLPIDITESFKFKRNETIIDVAAGTHHNILITNTGRIFLWGTEDMYDNDSERLSIPIDITSRFDLEIDEMIIKVESSYHNIAITSEGRIFAWGNNMSGQLGIGSYANIDDEARYLPNPIDITANFGLDQDDYIVDVSISRLNNLVLSFKGRIFTWGSQDINYNLVRSTPLEITHLLDLDENEVINRVSGDANIAITSLNNIYLIGIKQTFTTETGMLYQDVAHLVLVNLFNFSENESITDITSYRDSSHAITSSNRIFSWGMIRMGEPGNETTEYILPPIKFFQDLETPENTPKEITHYFELETDEDIAMIISNRSYTVVVTTQHRIFTWGTNQYGTLGDGTTENNFVPKDISEYFN